MRIFGIDVSLKSTGMCLIDDGHVETWTVESADPKEDDLHTRARRLSNLLNDILDSAEFEGADLVAIEAPAFSRSTGMQHERAGLWWMIVTALRDAGIRVVEIKPNLRAKYATGYGGGKQSGKDAVFAATLRRYDGVCLVNGNDEADALLLAAMAARHLGEPIERTSLPALNLAALDTIRWPA